MATSGLSRAVEILREHAAFLRAKGIAHASIVGSVARRSDDDSSDLDVLIETAEDHRLTVFDLVEIGERLSSSYGRHVDLIPAGALRARHAELREEAVRAF